MLQTNRFCNQHTDREKLCPGTGKKDGLCTLLAEHPHRTCPDHRASEEARNVRKADRFQSRHRDAFKANKHGDRTYDDAPGDGRVHSNDDADGEALEADAEIEAADAEAEGEIDGVPRVIQPTGFNGRWNRRRTHNEQVFVRPCGVVAFRKTFFDSEGIASVYVCPHWRPYPRSTLTFYLGLLGGRNGPACASIR